MVPIKKIVRIEQYIYLLQSISCLYFFEFHYENDLGQSACHLKKPGKSKPPCESHIVELFFVPWFEKLLALSLDEAKTRSLQDIKKKIGACKVIFWVKMLLVRKTRKFLTFLVIQL